MNALFEASDADDSGTIDKEEFETILQVCCGQILSRLLTYYAILILFVPWLATKIVDYWGIKEDTYYEMAAEQMTSMTIFFFIVPQVWNYIDAQSRDVATKQSVEVKKLKIKKSLQEKLSHKMEWNYVFDGGWWRLRQRFSLIHRLRGGRGRSAGGVLMSLNTGELIEEKTHDHHSMV